MANTNENTKTVETTNAVTAVTEQLNSTAQKVVFWAITFVVTIMVIIGVVLAMDAFGWIG